ncbi:MAG: PAS domain S-box protein [Wenzhouxiangellaceae bacterium]|nr:PAS domain S-box protein [Wenzhouxiangellaceae bacterium]
MESNKPDGADFARAAFEQLPIAVYWLDQAGCIRHVNQRAADMLGYDRETLCRMRIEQLNDRLTPEFWARHWEQLRDDRINHFHSHHRAADGRLLPVSVQVQLVNLEGTTYNCALVSEQRDESRRQQLELAQRDVLELIADPDVALERIFDRVVERTEALCPEVRASVLLVRDGRIWHGSAPNLPVAYTQAINGLAIGPRRGSCGTAAWSGERVVAADIGSDPNWADFRELGPRYGFASCWSQPVRDSNGKTIATFAMYGHEPGTPSAFELELIEALARVLGIAIQNRRLADLFERVFDSSPSGLLLVNRDWKIVRANRMAENMFGHSSLRLIGMDIQQLVPTQQRERHGQLLQRFMQAPRPRMIEQSEGLAGQRSDGRQFPVEIGLTPLMQGHDQLLVLVTIIDLTRLKRREAELARSNAELDRFAYLASHDLKAPLHGIGQIADWIREDLTDQIDDETRNHLDLLQRRVVRMQRLLDDLLQYSRAGRLEGQLRDTDLDASVRELFAMISEGCGFELRIAGTLPRMHTLSAPLEQVFVNLLGNAVKHHDRQHGVIEVLHVHRDHHHRFCIIDDGPGIESEYHERVFQMYQTLKPRDQVEGSGIGLSLVRKIVEGYGGQVTLESSGRGTRICFTWPDDKAMGELLRER